MNNSSSHILASDLGERKIVEKILKLLRPCPKEALPIGEDAAALSLGNNQALVVKADMLVGSTDVPPGMSSFQVGRKVVTMNFSDIAAKGAKPTGILISLGLPRDYHVEDALNLTRGVTSEAKQFGACVMGGDTSEVCGLVVSGMAIGFADKTNLVRRSGAAVGDILAVTGPFGLTGAGLKLLLGEMKSEPAIRKRLVKAVYEPRARVNEGITLAATGCLSSSIDSSDGLAWSIFELSRSSGLGFRIDEIPIPLEVTRFAEMNNLNPMDMALYGGEEYELVVTVKKNRWGEAERALKRVGGTLHRIGEAIKGRKITLKTHEGNVKEIEPKGYEHFK